MHALCEPTTNLYVGMAVCKAAKSSSRRRHWLAVIKVMKQILIRSWNTKIPRFDLVQAVSAMKSLRVWKQVYPVYIGSPILYDEGKLQKKK